ncbi:hypothetical protein D9Q98_003719 [Chlorella vulgaris]|uniref:Uncharacterized protein n=1 Tax=Chlorella vulgaris TaxID=3077 RepID=A0A9D4TTA2_CHLVU|nr:hypothetical protein D9Q98_003719 [Chlorella vulgaris]
MHSCRHDHLVRTAQPVCMADGEAGRQRWPDESLEVTAGASSQASAGGHAGGQGSCVATALREPVASV